MYNVFYTKAINKYVENSLKLIIGADVDV